MRMKVGTFNAGFICFTDVSMFHVVYAMRKYGDWKHCLVYTLLFPWRWSSLQLQLANWCNDSLTCHVNCKLNLLFKAAAVIVIALMLTHIIIMVVIWQCDWLAVSSEHWICIGNTHQSPTCWHTQMISLEIHSLTVYCFPYCQVEVQTTTWVGKIWVLRWEGMLL